MAHLMTAAHEWATRPDDERFATMEDLEGACRGMANAACIARRQISDLRAVATPDGDLLLQGPKGDPARLTHHAFGQLSRLAHAPAEFLRTLPAPLAADVLNDRLPRRAGEDANVAQILFYQNGSLLTRAFMTESYDLLWDHRVVAQVRQWARRDGWQVPPARPARAGQRGTRPATADDVITCGHTSLGIRVGDPIAPAGLYASDHDLFIFLVRPGEAIDGGGYSLNRGVFVRNSEVGECSLQVTAFTFDSVCGNHIVWGAQDVQVIRTRHVKGTREVSGRTLQRAALGYSRIMQALPPVDALSAKIAAARRVQIGATDDEVVDRVAVVAKVKALPLLTRATVQAAIDTARESPRYGSPHSKWGVVNGLTEVSQRGAHTDDRAALDVQAGRLLEIDF
jgi:Domain of unknown function (DUF932)